MKTLKIWVQIFIVAGLLAMVSSAKADSVDITWTSPAGDGSGNTGREGDIPTPLSVDEIAGFTLYIGVKSGDYTAEISIPDNLATSYTLEGMWGTTYYIVITATDTDGRQSIYSSEIVANVGDKPVIITRPKPPWNVRFNVRPPTSATP